MTIPPFRGGQGDSDEDIEREGGAMLAFVLALCVGMLFWLGVYLVSRNFLG